MLPKVEKWTIFNSSVCTPSYTLQKYLEEEFVKLNQTGNRASRAS